MDNTPFSKRCEILNDWYFILDEYDQHKSKYWTDFWSMHDLGFLVMKSIAEGLVLPQHITSNGVIFLDEMWDAFTLYMGISVLDNEETNFSYLEELLEYVDYPIDWLD
jgi:hypothetical protein